MGRDLTGAHGRRVSPAAAGGGTRSGSADAPSAAAPAAAPARSAGLGAERICWGAPRRGWDANEASRQGRDTPSTPPCQAVRAVPAPHPPQSHSPWSGAHNSPNSSVLRVSQALMPGLVPAVGTEAASSSKRQSHGIPCARWGRCWHLQAGTVGMAAGAQAEWRPCPGSPGLIVGDREPRVTSAHARATAALRAPKAQPCPTADSKGKPAALAFPTRAHRGSRGRQVPTPPHCCTLPGAGSELGASSRASHGGHVGTSRDTAGPGPQGALAVPILGVPGGLHSTDRP